MISDNLYGLKDIQTELLEILNEFDKLCEINNVKYSAFAGTMLGAVREKGFIPWDDDVDVIMDLTNYQNFKNALTKNNSFYIDTEDAWVPRFRRRSEKNGPFVDIFLFMDSPSGFTKTITLLRLKTLQGMLKKYTTVKKVSLKYKIMLLATKLMGKMFSREFLLKQYWKVGYGKTYLSDTVFVPNIGFNGLSFEFSKDKLKRGYTQIDFENIKVQIFKEYDYMLTVHFGSNYMIPVNETDRIQYHSEQIKG